METYKIIDVSEFQGNIDWERVKASGVQGAIIRCSVGLDYIDTKFARNVEECLRLGLHVGAYHFSWAGTADYAIKEAEKFIGLCKKYKFDLPLYYDIEKGDKTPRTSTAQLTTEAFINRCKELGYKVGVYANLDYFNNYLNPVKLKEYPLWIAQYYSKMTHKQPELFGMWQYTSTGRVDGINGKVDMNYCYVPYWEKLAEEVEKANNSNLNADISKQFLIMSDAFKNLGDLFLEVSKEQKDTIPKVEPAPNTPEKPIQDKRAESEPSKITSYIGNVKLQQMFLKYYFNFYKGNIDGQSGPLTLNAIKTFQSGQHLTPNGDWGITTDGVALSIGRSVQQALNNVGFNLSLDGIIGETTVGCITEFQKSHGLTTDGIIGLNTYKVLFDIKDPAPSTSSSSSSGMVSAHFAKSEFRCGCGGRYCDGYNGRNVSPKLLNILEKIRAYYGKPITITSGIRCQRYNDSLRGSIKNSVHRTGGAADIYIPGVTDTAAGRAQVKKLAYQYGAAYCYYGTSNMGNAVHINI